MVKFYFIVFALLISCKIRYAELGIQRKDYETLPFRTDGYYYNFNSDNTGGKEFVNVFFYYKSGIELHWGNSSLVSFDVLEERFVDSLRLMRSYAPRMSWAVFEIKGDSMVLETWTETMLSKKGTFKMYYKIINDTTIYSIGLDDYHHFRAFSPKPDSTYSPIK